jgi:subtilisin family serine protease
LFEVPREKRDSIEASLNALPEVLYAEKNTLGFVPTLDIVPVDLQTLQSQYEGQAASSFPDDPYYPFQWAPQKMDADIAWVWFSRGAGAKIAVLDEGFYIGHEDLTHIAGMPKKNFTDYGSSTNVEPHPDFSLGHGTGVLGIMAAKLDNSKGIAGIAPDATYMRGKICLHFFACNGYDTADGIEWAVDNGADIISLSILNSTGVNDIYYALDYADYNDVAVFIAGGNNGDEGAEYPASHPQSIPVGAVSYESVSDTLSRHPTSNYDDDFIFAPGIQIVTTGEDGPSSYVSFNGTSASAPHAAGLGGIYVGFTPEAYHDADMIEAFERTSALHLLPSSTYGDGFVWVHPDHLSGEASPPSGCRRYDLVPDTEIDSLDAQAIAFRWGAQTGSLLYLQKFDFNGSGIIEISDLQQVYARYGLDCPY